MPQARFVNIDRETPLLLPLDLREWVKDDDLANFILLVVAGLDMSQAAVNQRGSGDAQYPPGMMLAVLLYCYATGIFSSRQIERLTHQHVSVRYLAGNEHPDHDTICKFRRENGALIKAALGEVLRVASQLQLGRVGTICLDGTKIVANAARRRTFNDEGLQAEQARLDLKIEELLAKAEAADAQSEPETTRLPQALRGYERLREQVAQARAQLKEQVQERAQAREKDRAAWKEDPLGDCPRALPSEPGPKDRINLTDPQSTLQPQADKRYVIGYNAQLAVTGEAKSLIVAAAVCTDTNDRQQLQPMAESLPAPTRAALQRLVLDTGYDNPRQIVAVEKQLGIEIICAPQGGRDDEREHPDPEAGLAARNPVPSAASTARQPQSYRVASQAVRKRLKERSRTKEGRAALRLRRTTVEPVFGLIKSVLGFRRFSLRGLAKVNVEWQLVAVAFNCRRLCGQITKLN